MQDPLAANDDLIFVLRLSGEYDLTRREELRLRLREAPFTERATLDMRDVTFMDATALTELIRLKERLTGPAVVRMIQVQPNVRRLLRITGLDKRFEIHDALLSPAPEVIATTPVRHQRG
ncbi:MAG TPA: STAS domain-containing protein [Candidatus Baltobacteraceae bacterium]|jgi:anti-anti-sigma factor